MKRRSFFGSLAALVAAPAVLAKEQPKPQKLYPFPRNDGGELSVGSSRRLGAKSFRYIRMLKEGGYIEDKS